MMKQAIIGAGGFSREVIAQMGYPKIPKFIDDNYWVPNDNDILPLSSFDESKYRVLIAIGNPIDRYNMVNKLPKNTKYFSFVHPSVLLIGDDIKIGEGSIICAGAILTTNITIGKHAHLNLQTTIGHDCVIGDYFTTAPGAKVSGNCEIGDRVYLGTNASIREKIRITNDVTIGLNGGVVKNIDTSGTYVGTPCKIIS